MTKTFTVPFRELIMDERAVKLALADLLRGHMSKSTDRPISVYIGDFGLCLGDGYHRVLQSIMLGKRSIKAVKDARFATEFGIPKNKQWVIDEQSPTRGLPISVGEFTAVKKSLMSAIPILSMHKGERPMAAQPKHEMTELLAFHMGRQDQAQKWVDAIPHFLTVASPEDLLAIEAGLEGQQPGQEGVRPADNDRLKILIDGDSQKMVTQLYQNYVSEENFVLFIEFVKGMDRFIVKFRELAQSREIAQQVPSEEEEEGAEIGNGRRRGKSRGRRPAAAAKPGPVLDQAPNPNEEELRRNDAPSATVASSPKEIAAFFGQRIRSR